MRTRRHRIAALLASLLMGACATPLQSLTPGQDAQHILTTLGSPQYKHATPDGGSLWNYSGQPYGTNCWQLSLDANGQLRKVEDTLDEGGRARVVPGMSRADVETLLCPARAEDYFAASDETVLEWNIRNDGPGLATLFNVHFKAGVVIRTSISWVFAGDMPDD